MTETRQCQNCKQNFVIEPEDFEFYERIQVPPPTWCPECRLMRRFAVRNERCLYRRSCPQCGKQIISIYSPDGPFRILCAACWWSDKWDPLSYGRPYDFSRPFFLQYRELMEKVPHLATWGFQNVASEYTNYTAFSKNVYLGYSVVNGEDVFYSFGVDKSFSCFDSFQVRGSTLCYENINTESVRNSFFLMNSRECLDSWFLFDCVNCRNCFMCSNLRNKSFYVRDKPYSREEYYEMVGAFDLGSRRELDKLKREFKQVEERSLHRYGNIVKCVDVSGDDIARSKNARFSFFVQDAEDVAYMWRAYEFKDSYDVSGALQSELLYEVSVGGSGHYFARFYDHSKTMRDSQYFHNCIDSTHLFGCVGLRNKRYCILNKAYSKEEYEELVPRIIQHMNETPYVDQRGRIYKYGEFFPPDLSSFAYNETVAQEVFPFTKEQALAQGYKWRDPDPKQYTITRKPDELPDHIKEVGDDILKETIGCEHESKCTHQCTTAFRIIPEELQFYRKTSLPLPRLCPNCRHCERLARRNPLKLWKRKCQCAGAKSENGVYTNTAQHQHGAGKCPNEFETSYSPERGEIVYCKQCYNAEVV